MVVVCLDLEGVLVPEIWIEVSKKTKIKELALTTRDIPDYDVLMRRRMDILRRHRIRLRDIQRVISTMKPLPKAKAFLDKLRDRYQVIILSDTFAEFAMPLMRKLDLPTIFCNELKVDGRGFISGYRLRQKNGKEKAVRALQGIGFEVRAAGDSYNDITMLKAAQRGVLFRPPDSIRKQFSRFPAVDSHPALLRHLLR